MICTACDSERFAPDPMYGGLYCVNCGHPVAAQREPSRRWKSPEDRAKRNTRWFVWLLALALLVWGIGYLLKTTGVIR